MKAHGLWVVLVAVLAGVFAPASRGEADPFAANACVQCHRDLPGRSSQLVELEWKQSVHYGAKVGCEGCHGGNAALRRDQFTSDEAFKRASHLERNPEALLIRREGEFVSAARGRSVSYLCGKCHMQIKEQHLGSPHGEFGDPTCLYCHGQGSHRITSPTLDVIDLRARADSGRCRACHRTGTTEAVAGIKRTLTNTQERMKVSGEQYKQLEAWGYRNLELEKLHHHAAETRSQLRQIFHSLNMRQITNFAGEVDGVADRTAAAFELVGRLRDKQRRQTVVGAMAVLLLLSFAGVLMYYKNHFLSHSGVITESIVQAGGQIATPATAVPRAAGEVIPMDRTHRQGGRRILGPERASLLRMGAGLAIIHFYATMIWIAAGLVLRRVNPEIALFDSAVSHIFRWPLLPLLSSVPALFWPMFVGNSLIWGFALATPVWLVRNWWSLRARTHIDP